MKPAKFDCHSPTAVEEALALLERYQGEARVLTGGRNLVGMMNFRLTAPVAIVDLNRIPGLADIAAADEVVTIGAMARQRQIEFSPVLRERLPLPNDIHIVSQHFETVGQHLPASTPDTLAWL